MFQPGQRIGIAVSGGADSVCLLHLLRDLAPRWSLSLSVLHLDHQLRGDESRQDAAFVRDLALSLNLPYEHRATDVAAFCRETGENLEQAARHARLEFFRALLESKTVDRIATAHTRSDQAETVLFRFLRGAGTAGFAGIRPVTPDGIVRPLLEIDRVEIEAYLEARAISWRTDSTNISHEFARNRIRHQLLPQLARDWNPAIAETLAHTADWAQAEESYWDAELARLVPAHLVVHPPVILLQTPILGELRLAVARRLVRRAVELSKGDLRGVGFDHLSAILELAASPEGHGRIQVPGLDVFRSFEWLRLAPPGFDSLDNRNYRLQLPVPGAVQPPGQKALVHTELFEKAHLTESPPHVYNGYVEYLDWNRLSGSLEVRNWRPGDQYQPVGHSGPEKLKFLFHAARVPLWERRHWPVVVMGEEILWVRRFGPAAGFAATPGGGKVLGIWETEM